MRTRNESSLASLLLANHLVRTDAEPLRASEFWPLIDRIGDPALLLGLTAEAAAEKTGADGERISSLLDAATGLAFELERMEQSGMTMLSPFDDEYPTRLRERLADAAPPLLYAVGPLGLLQRDGIGIVGSRNVGAEARDVAGELSRAAARAGLPVVSGAAKGIDQTAMDAAFEAGGEVVGVLADSLEKRLREPTTRRAIGEERVCLITPYKPTAGFNVGNAMGRNKIIYAMTRCTVVVTSDEGKGGTWAGAEEALRRQWARVAVWTGPGAGPGNAKLVRMGAVAIASAEEALSLEAQPAPAGAGEPIAQLDLGL